MSREALLVLLKNARDAMEAAISLIESEENDACDHPENKRLDLSTMGHEAWECKLCGYKYEEVK